MRKNLRILRGELRVSFRGGERERFLNACTEAGVWKISFVAVQEDKTNARKRLKKIKK